MHIDRKAGCNATPPRRVAPPLLVTGSSCALCARRGRAARGRAGRRRDPAYGWQAASIFGSAAQSFSPASSRIFAISSFEKWYPVRWSSSSKEPTDTMSARDFAASNSPPVPITLSPALRAAPRASLSSTRTGQPSSSASVIASRSPTPIPIGRFGDMGFDCAHTVSHWSLTACAVATAPGLSDARAHTRRTRPEAGTSR